MYKRALVICTCCCSCLVWLILSFNLPLAGKNEFAPDEDAHVVGDCVKVLLLLPVWIYGY